MPEFSSALILRRRVKELESSTKRETGELSELLTLISRVEKRSQRLRKRVRIQRRKTAATELGLALARCDLAAAQIREYVASWARTHPANSRAPSSVAELEQNVASLVTALVAIVEQSLKAVDDAARQLDAPPLSDSPMEPAEEGPDDEESEHEE